MAIGGHRSRKRYPKVVEKGGKYIKNDQNTLFLTCFILFLFEPSLCEDVHHRVTASPEKPSGRRSPAGVRRLVRSLVEMSSLI